MERQKHEHVSAPKLFSLLPVTILAVIVVLAANSQPAGIPDSTVPPDAVAFTENLP